MTPPRGAERSHGAAARRLWRARLSAPRPTSTARHRPAGLVERRQRDARRHGGRARLRAPSKGFPAALVFYPACGLKGHSRPGSRLTRRCVCSMARPTRKSRRRCEGFVECSRAPGGDIAIQLYPGATHGFDDPGREAAASRRTPPRPRMRSTGAVHASSPPNSPARRGPRRRLATSRCWIRPGSCPRCRSRCRRRSTHRGRPARHGCGLPARALSPGLQCSSPAQGRQRSAIARGSRSGFP